MMGSEINVDKKERKRGVYQIANRTVLRRVRGTGPGLESATKFSVFPSDGGVQFCGFYIRIQLLRPSPTTHPLSGPYPSVYVDSS